MDTYEQYFVNYDNVVAILKECQETNEPFRDFIQSLSFAPSCDFLSLESLLLLPAQRIAAYSHAFQVTNL